MPKVENWLTRPGVIALGAFVVGAAVAGIIVAIVFTAGGDDNGGPKVSTTPNPSAVTGTPAPLTPTLGRFTNPNDALAAFVQAQFNQPHVGPCPSTSAGICSTELYRSDQLATYFVGPSQSEGLGEVVLTVNEDGTWSVTFVTAAPLGSALVVGQQAVVYGAGDCLNFRAAASASAAVASCQLDGTQARVAEGPVTADGVTWWRLDGYGWASQQYLQPAQ